jgi:ribosomal protein L13E
MLEATVARDKRQGRILAGWLESEMRKLGVDEKAARELGENIRAYLGGERDKRHQIGGHGWIDVEDLT